MKYLRLTKTHKKIVIGYSIALAAFMLTACLGNTAEDEEVVVDPNPGQITDNETYWQEFKLVTPLRNGLMNPYFDAVIDSNNILHIVYYSLSADAEDESESLYDLNYARWNIATQEFSADPATAVITSLVHSDRIALAIDGQDQLYVTYRGGNEKPCQGGTIPADTMFSVFNGYEWSEYTGAIGYVERSSGALLDGHAGANADIAVDESGHVHMIYQFAYEGCDAMNYAYPDLFYASKIPSQFSFDARTDAEIEEQVSGNDADNGGNFQNSTGEVSDIILDDQGQPLVFYYSQDSTRSAYGLYMGYRDEADHWSTEPIREECQVVDIDAAMASNGDLHVAYVIKNCGDENNDSEFSLRHARKLAATLERPNPEWENGYVVDNVQVGGIGRHLSMVMNKNGLPQIAYFELQTYAGQELKNLTSVELTTQGTYLQKDIARWNDIGRYNKTLTDDEGEIYVLSYASETQSIHLFVEGVNGRLVP